jgi:hypothetical protein
VERLMQETETDNWSFEQAAIIGEAAIQFNRFMI